MYSLRHVSSSQSLLGIFIMKPDIVDGSFAIMKSDIVDAKRSACRVGVVFLVSGTGMQNSPYLAHFHRCPCLVSRTLTFR